MTPMTVQLLCASQCQLGEGPLWVNDASHPQGRLYWFDILQQRLHTCATDGSDPLMLQCQEHFSAAARFARGGLLLASASALWHYQPDSQAMQKLVGLEADNSLTRSNDGRADRHGGFWIGTMGKRAEFEAGAIYRYYQGELTCLRSRVSIPNAICFAPDGQTAYFADSMQGVIYRWNLDAAGWPVGEPRVLVDLSNTGIAPDGAVVDAAGFIWNAQWDGSRLVRYAPDGRTERIVPLPVSRPTCPAFAGANLDTLFVTTARDGLDELQLGREPWAGGVLMLKLDVPGLAEGVAG